MGKKGIHFLSQDPRWALGRSRERTGGHRAQDGPSCPARKSRMDLWMKNGLKEEELELTLQLGEHRVTDSPLPRENKNKNTQKSPAEKRWNVVQSHLPVPR